MYAMSAQTVLDSVNKYRHGVLIGNFVQDQFGIDLAKKGPNPDARKIPTTKEHHDLSHSLYRKNQIIDESQTINKTFYDTAKQNPQMDYERPQKLTSYSIFYQPQAPPGLTLSNLENNPKKQEYLNKNGQLYQQTRYLLANKFGSHEQKTQKLVQQQIPDILTGQILKPKKQLVVENKNQNRHLTTKLNTNMAQTKSINPYGTYSLIKPQIKKFEEVEYKNLVMPNPKGQKRDVLFGHGLALQDFQKRQLATSYDLSFNQKVKPQVQINSFYEPGLTQTSKHFHKQQVYQKNHQKQIPLYGTKQAFNNPKVARPYEPYTKTFDQNHLKNQYLRK